MIFGVPAQRFGQRSNGQRRQHCFAAQQGLDLLTGQRGQYGLKHPALLQRPVGEGHKVPAITIHNAVLKVGAPRTVDQHQPLALAPAGQMRQQGQLQIGPLCLGVATGFHLFDKAADLTVYLEALQADMQQRRGFQVFQMHTSHHIVPGAGQGLHLFQRGFIQRCRAVPQTAQ